MGSEARARLGLIALVVVTLFSFTQVFDGGSYPGPSLLAMAFATGIAMGMRRLGAGAMLTFLASAVGLLSYLSWIFEGRRAWFLVPTGASIRGLVDSVTTALDAAAVDFAPVPPRPGYIILITAGMWILTTIGELATFRWRKPLVASLGCVALFSFVMVVGTGAGSVVVVLLFLGALYTYWSLEAAHRLRSWGSWVSTWREGHSEPPVLSHATARRMGASSLVIALVAPIFMPAVGDALLSWKSGQGEGPGGGGGGRINPLVSINTRLVEQSDEEMFRVTTDDAVRWKLVTLERYEPAAGEWTERTTTVGNLEDAVDRAGLLPRVARGRVKTTRFEITGLRGENLPLRYPTFELDIAEGGEEGDLKATVETGDLALSGGLDGDEVYEVSSMVPTMTYAQLRRARVGDASTMPEELTDIGDPLPPEVIELRDSWIEGARTPFERLVAIQDRFQGPAFSYSLEAGREQSGAERSGAEALAHFLLRSRTGYCQQFAAAFSLLARSLGYPTRIAVGFLPGTRLGAAPAREDVPLPEGESEYAVTGKDAHAWPEVYFEGYGWLAFEPTPRDDVSTPTPSYTDPDPVADDPDVRANNGPAPGQGDTPRGPQPEDPNLPEGAVPGERGAEGPINDAWKRPFTRLAAIVGTAVVLFLVGVPLLKTWRVRRRYRRASTPAGRTAAAFAEFQQEATELALPRRESESAPAYAQRVTTVKKLDPSHALRLASIYERAEYGAAGVEPNVAEEARRLARSLRASLWSRAGWWQRAMRLFSIAGLRSD